MHGMSNINRLNWLHVLSNGGKFVRLFQNKVFNFSVINTKLSSYTSGIIFVFIKLVHLKRNEN